MHAWRDRLLACADGCYLRAGHQCLHRDRDRFDDSPRLWCSPRPTRWKERLARLDRRARGTMARDRLLRRHFRGWLCDFRVVEFSADATFRSGRARRPDRRYSGESIRVAAPRRRPVEKEIITADNKAASRLVTPKRP